jgi:hypothetical protein
MPELAPVVTDGPLPPLPEFASKTPSKMVGLRISVQSCPGEVHESPDAERVEPDYHSPLRKSHSVTTPSSKPATNRFSHPPPTASRDSHYDLTFHLLDPGFKEALATPRYTLRRDALAHPLAAPRMPQETRERIQEEANVRKARLSRKVSQFFKMKISTGSVEVDLF